MEGVSKKPMVMVEAMVQVLVDAFGQVYNENQKQKLDVKTLQFHEKTSKKQGP